MSDSTAGRRLQSSTLSVESFGRASSTARNKIILALAFAAVWIWAAIAPVSREDWLMENILVFFAIGLLLFLRRYFRISTLSLGLIFLFLALHEIGAHYVYGDVPFGFWLKNTFHLARNDYDRIVHFAFGLCWSYAIREMYLQLPHPRGFITYYLPFMNVLGLSAVYEIIEAYTAQANPQMAASFVGLQGDLFDSQRDMLCSASGAIACLIVIVLLAKWGRTRPAGRARGGGSKS